MWCLSWQRFVVCANKIGTLFHLIISNLHHFSSHWGIWSSIKGEAASHSGSRKQSWKTSQVNYAQAEVCLLQLSLSSSSQPTLVLSKQMPHKYPFLKKGKHNRKNKFLLNHFFLIIFSFMRAKQFVTWRLHFKMIFCLMLALPSPHFGKQCHKNT